MAKKRASRSRPRRASMARKPPVERGWTRRPLHRIYEIHTWVKAGRYPNCQQLAKELEMTAKTVQRDINFMRDELNLPLAYDEQRWLCGDAVATTQDTNRPQSTEVVCEER